MLDFADDTLLVVIDICDLSVVMWSLIAFTSLLSSVVDAIIVSKSKIKFAIGAPSCVYL